MSRFRFVASIALFMMGCDPSEEAPTTASTEIVGGTVDHQSPSVAALLRVDPDDHQGRAFFLCSATLIAPRAALTAAHCDKGANATYVLALGQLLVANGSGPDGLPRFPTVGLPRIRLHVMPDYDRNRLDRGDIAVAELEAAITNVSLPPLRRTAMNDAYERGQRVRFVGFGVDEQRRLGLRRTATNAITYVSDHVFFLGAGADTCFGDSGGPAFMTVDGVEVLAGVTSGGSTACSGGGQYTRVDAFVPWIEATVARFR